MKFRRVASALALALITTSCSLGDVTDAGSLNIFIEVDDPQLTVGQDIVAFTVTARNVGFDPLSLSGPSDCLVHVEVFNNTGSMVWSSNAGCTGQIVTEEIAATGEKIATISWDGRNSAGSFLAPGLYLVRPVARTTPLATIGPPITIALD